MLSREPQTASAAKHLPYGAGDPSVAMAPRRHSLRVTCLWTLRKPYTPGLEYDRLAGLGKEETKDWPPVLWLERMVSANGLSQPAEKSAGWDCEFSWR